MQSESKTKLKNRHNTGRRYQILWYVSEFQVRFGRGAGVLEVAKGLNLDLGYVRHSLWEMRKNGLVKRTLNGGIYETVWKISPSCLAKGVTPTAVFAKLKPVATHEALVAARKYFGGGQKAEAVAKELNIPVRYVRSVWRDMRIESAAEGCSVCGAQELYARSLCHRCYRRARNLVKGKANRSLTSAPLDVCSILLKAFKLDKREYAYYVECLKERYSRGDGLLIPVEVEPQKRKGVEDYGKEEHDRSHRQPSEV